MSALLQQAPRGVRPMVETDVGAIMEIELRTYEFPWTDGIFRDCLRIGYCCWIYEEADVVLAYAVMSVGASEAHILNICVIPEERGRGLARHLLIHLLQVARDHKADVVFLEVRPSNPAAIALYQTSGFNEVGMRKAYYPAANGKEDAIIFARSLA